MGGGAGVADQSSALADQSSAGAGPAAKSNGAAVPVVDGATTGIASVAQSLVSSGGAKVSGCVFHWSGMVTSSFCGAFSTAASASFSAW